MENTDPLSDGDIPAEASPETELAPEPVAAQPATLRRQPAWSYFLTPIAVVIGSVIIAGAIWYTDDDPPASAADTHAASMAGDESGAGMSVAPTVAPSSSGATTMLATLLAYAKQLGLDQAKFQQCLGKQETSQAISRQLQRGQALGVNGTPTFFINNKRIVGSQPAAIFDEVIAAELRGSPTTLDGYSDGIRQLAATSPPRFVIEAQKVDVSDAAIEGNPAARVMIAEFSDFQCPFCRRWTQDYLSKIRANLGNDVALAFLHFPIISIHPNAGNASAGAVCAGEQGKFWQMHDLLFSNQDTWASLKAN
ncbi:MAG: thioredoxin domain-containing protein [Chloroflexi bacterium]|nr:thioredoxin domain-containing protein [Chloroflexota bacterium]